MTPMAKLRVVIMIIMCLLTALLGCQDRGQEIRRMVIDKKYYASYTSVYYIHIGETMIPQIQYHPERYVLIYAVTYEKLNSPVLQERDVPSSTWHEIKLPGPQVEAK